MMTDDWRKCYAGGWQGLIVPEAFAHPAKFSRALIRRIYEHCFEEGWLQAGSTIVDPFGGVGMGALHALQHGLNWVGVELEEKFCLLSQQNLDLWNERYSRLPGWGTARIVQGDSRRLGEVLAGAELCLTSPPYANSDVVCAGGDMGGTFKKGGAGGHSHQENGYGPSPHNLGNLPAGDIDLALSSPPYASQTVHGRAGPFDVRLFERAPGPNGQIFTCDDYGDTEGQLGGMQEGGFEAVVSSPPFITQQKGGGIAAALQGESDYPMSFNRTAGNINQGYQAQGAGEGQLAAMREGEFADCAISSPPFENVVNTKDPKYVSEKRLFGDYGSATGQLGRETGDTFWSASRTILEQVYQVLVPGGHAVFVLKKFVRNKKIVDFPAQWRELCEAVGFTTLHLHRAWLVEERGAQWTLEGELEVKRVKRCSFFRRLHERKYPHLAIDFEEVLCLVK